MSVDDHPGVDEEEPAAPPLAEPTTELLFSAGQSAWLAAVTVGVLIAIGLSIAALVVAANDSGGGGGSAAPSGPASELTIEASEFRFDPADVTIAADTDVPVTIDNVGAVEHSWTVLELGTTIASEGDYDESTAVVDLHADPGSTESGSVNLAAGSYQVICVIPGHFAAGMEGSIEVTS
jgi:uncharacterized cupredoxin-like copper-binding protein